MAKDTAKRAVIIQEFQNEFQARGVLIEGSRVVCNRTPYEFEQEELKAVKKDSGMPENEMYVSEPQNAGGRKIVLFYQEKAGLGIDAEEYSFIIYKDVTEIYIRIQALFLKGLIFTILLLSVTGLALHRGIYRVIRPLAQLRQTAEQIAGGDYESRVVAGGTDRRRTDGRMCPNTGKLYSKAERTGCN